MDFIERMVRTNGRINAAMIDGLEADDWNLTDGLGGESIRYQLTHIAHFRYGWLRELAPEHMADARATMKRGEDGSVQMLISEPQDIKAALFDGDNAALQAVQSATAQNQSFKGYADPAMILARTSAHDANHRGIIMSVLRINDRKRPEIRRAMYGLWGEA